MILRSEFAKLQKDVNNAIRYWGESHIRQVAVGQHNLSMLVVGLFNGDLSCRHWLALPISPL